MRIKSISLEGFKRFNKLTIRDLPELARLVVLTGPNGSGKSSLFDAFATWYNHHRDWGNFDPSYHVKSGLPHRGWSDCVRLEFDRPLPSTSEQRKKLFYFRSAYRHEAEFVVSQFGRQPSALDNGRRVKRMIEPDVNVSANYSRLVAVSVAEIFDPKNHELQVGVLRDRLIGQVRESMVRVFGELLLSGTGDPMQDGSFYFDKGQSRGFHYKNLSGGEKAAFDLLLDLVLKREAYDDTIFCIDEPELHMHTRTQGLLLEELFRLMPAQSQLWISTHSIGMMRKACQLAEHNPEQVMFLDFSDKAFDAEAEITPTKPSRQYWKGILAIALDDLAGLVAPQQVVLCEGRPVKEGGPESRRGQDRAEFDAACLRAVFGPHMPDTDFMSVGNSSDVKTDRLGAGKVISTLVAGTKIIRLVDRDDCSDTEVEQLKAAGVRVLSRRHVEAFFYDDEVLERLCITQGKSDDLERVLRAKQDALEASFGRGNPSDDVKSAAGPIYTSVKQVLGLTRCGNTSDAFCRDTLAPLITPEMAVYRQLYTDIFG